MKTTKNDVTTVICNTCKKSKYTMEGKGTSGLKTYLKGKGLGWRWTNKQDQTCPSCLAKEKAAKASKTERMVLSGKSSKKNSSAKTVAPVGGQSIGRLARSAKQAPAPAAE